MKMGKSVSLKAVFAVLTIGSTFSSPAFAVLQVKSTYTTDTGNVCFKCPPGTKVQEDCQANLTVTKPTDPVCVPCDDLHYMGQENGEKYCQECRPGNCLGHQEEAEHCTRTTNRVCRCKAGFHMFKLDKIEKNIHCRPHTVCEHGEGEVNYGNTTHDTKCRKCDEHNEFVNTSDPAHPKCQACRTCSDGTGVVANCTLCAQDERFTNPVVLALVYAGQVLVATPLVVLMFWRRKKEKAKDEGVSRTRKYRTGLKVVIGILLFVPLVGLISAAMLGTYILLTRKKRRTAAHKQTDCESGNKGGAQYTTLTRQEVPSPEQGAGTADDVSAWSQQFITSKGFSVLCKNIAEWEKLIFELPGWSDGCNINTIIAHKKLDNPNSTWNQFHACLTSWYQQCPHEVTQDNICAALESVELNDVIEKLKKEYDQYLLQQRR